MMAAVAPAATIHVGNTGAGRTRSSRCGRTSVEGVGFPPPSLLSERLRAGGLGRWCDKGLTHHIARTATLIRAPVDTVAGARRFASSPCLLTWTVLDRFFNPLFDGLQVE